MERAHLVSWLTAACLVFAGSASGTEGVHHDPIVIGTYRDDVQGEVDRLIVRNGIPDTHRRTRTTIWEDGGAKVSCTVDYNGLSVLITETWSEAADGSSYYPPQWRVQGVGSIQVGMQIDAIRESLRNDGSRLIAGSEGTSGQEEWLQQNTTYYFTTTDTGILSAYELLRSVPDWETGVSRCRWLQVLGPRISDVESEEWAWTGRNETLIRSGDYLAKEWTARVEPLH